MKSTEAKSLKVITLFIKLETSTVASSARRPPELLLVLFLAARSGSVQGRAAGPSTVLGTGPCSRCTGCRSSPLLSSARTSAWKPLSRSCRRIEKQLDSAKMIFIILNIFAAQLR